MSILDDEINLIEDSDKGIYNLAEEKLCHYMNQEIYHKWTRKEFPDIDFKNQIAYDFYHNEIRPGDWVYFNIIGSLNVDSGMEVILFGVVTAITKCKVRINYAKKEGDYTTTRFPKNIIKISNKKSFIDMFKDKIFKK